MTQKKKLSPTPLFSSLLFFFPPSRDAPSLLLFFFTPSQNLGGGYRPKKEKEPEKRMNEWKREEGERASVRPSVRPSSAVWRRKWQGLLGDLVGPDFSGSIPVQFGGEGSGSGAEDPRPPPHSPSHPIAPLSFLPPFSSSPPPFGGDKRTIEEKWSLSADSEASAQGGERKGKKRRERSFINITSENGERNRARTSLVLSLSFFRVPSELFLSFLLSLYRGS